MTKLFRNDNTDGYSQEDLNALNEEWEKFVEQKNLEPDTDEYGFHAKKFSDEVARR